MTVRCDSALRTPDRLIELRGMVGVGARRAVLVVALAWAGLLAGAAGAHAQSAFAPVAGSPFATGSSPYSVAFSPSGGLLATANYGANSVSVFSISAEGALTPVAGSPFASNGGPVSVAFSPSGGLLATANFGANSVSVFSVSADGALTPVAGFPLATGSRPYSVAFSPSGGLLATASSDANSVSVFRLSAEGALTPAVGSPFATGRSPRSVAFSPSGGLLAAANSGTNNVSVFSVSADGALTPVADSPFATGSNPYSVAFSPSGRLLATANTGAHKVSVFRVSAEGALTPVAGSPFATGSGPFSVAFSPSGGLLATANNNASSVSVFSVSAAGALTPVAGSPFAIGSLPRSVAFGPSGGLFATASAGDSTVAVFAPTGGFVVAKVADHTQIGPGGVLSYTITLHGAGAGGGSGSVSDDLSGVLDKASYRNDARASSGTVRFDGATKRLVWTGTLGPSENATITYSVTVHGSARGLVSNRVAGPPGSSCAAPLPPQLPCVTETPIVRAPAPGPDLALVKTASSATVHPGRQVSFVLALQNQGPRAATGVTVEDPVPSGLFLQSAQPSQGTCTLTAAELVCQLGSLVSGGQALVSVNSTVAADARGTLVNQASVFGKQPDPDPVNNLARSAVTIQPGPQPIANLVVTKHVNHRTARVKQRLTYTITVTNAGPNAASDVRLIDGSRRPLKVVSIHPKQGRCTPGRPIRCSLGTLAIHKRTTVTLKAIARVAGVQINAAVAFSGSWDPAVRSNLALAKTTIRPAHTPPPPRVTG